MGSDPTVLCTGLAQRVLPVLCQAVEAEAKAAPAETDPSWRAAQVLFATLGVSLPPGDAPCSDPAHPGLALWRAHWKYVEAALLHWPQSSATDQPAASAAGALTDAASALPALLPEVLPLLAGSAAKHSLPQAQLEALRAVANRVQCPPVNALHAAELVAVALVQCAEGLLTRQTELLQSPTTLAAFFGLLADALRPSPPGTEGGGLCADQLRPRMLTQTTMLSRCISMVPLALPDCTSAEATAAMLRFLAGLLGGEEELAPQALQRPILVTMLPGLCGALCHALATLQHLAELDEGLIASADVLLRAASALPQEFPASFQAGILQAQVPAWSGAQLQAHVGKRAEWLKKGEWLEKFQQIVCEWQRERRRVQH